LIIFQAKLNNFAHSSHKSVEIFRLGVATSQGRHGSDVVVFFVSFDNNREFPLRFHVLILARQRKTSVVEDARFAVSAIADTVQPLKGHLVLKNSWHH
jgi:hypothetical protein